MRGHSLFSDLGQSLFSELAKSLFSDGNNNKRNNNELNNNKQNLRAFNLTVKFSDIIIPFFVESFIKRYKRYKVTVARGESPEALKAVAFKGFTSVIIDICGASRNIIILRDVTYIQTILNDIIRNSNVNTR